MKYMNHLRKLALLSSLALSFSVAVQADGTLPLPIADGTLPLALEDQNVDLRVALDDMDFNTISDTINGKKACARTESFYPAAGAVSHGTKNLKLVGICKLQNEPKTLKVVNRTVVAVPEGQDATNASAIVRMTGSVKLNTKGDDFETFKGTMTTELLVPGAPVVTEAETLSLTPVPFMFIR